MDETKERHKESQPLLNYRDITELLDYYLPRSHREDEVHLRSENVTKFANVISLDDGRILVLDNS